MDDEPTILILSGVQRDPRRYRTFHLYEQACLAGLKAILSHVTDPEIRKKASMSEVVILHRAAWDAQIAWLEKEIHGKGGALIFDLDDLVFDPEAVKFIYSLDFVDPIRRSLYQEDVQRVRKSLLSCDAVITSGDFLAEQVRLLGKLAFVHRNAFSLEMLAISEAVRATPKTGNKKIVIGYASGTPTHDQDFATIKPALQSILLRCPNVELWLVGQLDPGADFSSLHRQVKILNFVPWRSLPGIQVQFDINLAPLQVDNPFGQSKSEIKYIEAALLRVPTIASPSESYKFAIHQGDNGFLAKDGQDWEHYLEALVENHELRKTVGENAYQDALQRYHPQTRARQLVDMLNSITANQYEFQFQDTSINISDESLQHTFWSSAKLERSPSVFQRGIYTIRYRNIQTLLKQSWIFIRRTVSSLLSYRNPT